MKDPKQDPAFYHGRGPGRGFDIAEKRGPQKAHGRGVAGEEKLEIDLGNLDQPGTGPVNFQPMKGMDIDSDSDSD